MEDKILTLQEWLASDAFAQMKAEGEKTRERWKELGLSTNAKLEIKPALSRYSPLAIEILEKIKNGDDVPTGNNNKNVNNTLTKLRRNGLIVNTGSRARPDWKLKE